MKLDPILQEELHTYLPKSEILFITRAKLYVFNEGQAKWTYNCQGFFLILRDRRTDVVTLVIIHAINFEVFFEMEHYSNFMNYCKLFSEAQFFLFLVPTNYIPLKFGLSLESRDELQQLKRVIDKIEFKDHVSKLVPEKDNILEREQDIIERPEFKTLLKKAGVEENKLQSDLLFRQNVTNILTEHMKKDTRQEEKQTSRFRALALDEVQLEHAAGYTLEKEKEQMVLKKLVQQVRQEKIRNKY